MGQRNQKIFSCFARTLKHLANCNFNVELTKYCHEERIYGETEGTNIAECINK